MTCNDQKHTVMAFGNSDGDKYMLAYTQAGSGAQFMLRVLPDDAARQGRPLFHYTFYRVPDEQQEETQPET